MAGLGRFSRYRTGESDLKRASVKRDTYSNKYRNGRILIIGGSSQYYGAPILALNAAHESLAALRIGAGYVKTFVPLYILPTVRSLSPNTIIQELGKRDIVFNDTIKKEIRKTDIILIGMGIGRKSEGTARKIIEYALKSGKKVIVDADAIPSIKKIKIKNPGSVLVTPHDGEFYRLTGKKVSASDLKQRIEQCRIAAKKLNAVILLKGHYTVISNGSDLKINQAKTAALATMGTGDVLSGIIGGYAAIGNDLFTSAAAGAYLHSKIGDTLYKKDGKHIIATDIIDHIRHM